MCGTPHWKRGQYTQASSETTDFPTEDNTEEDMWDVLFRTPVSLWKANVCKVMVEEEVRREYSNLTERQPPYSGVRNNADGTFSFTHLGNEFQGFQNAWCAAVCREYANVRAPRGHGFKRNFDKDVFTNGTPLRISTCLERLGNWNDLLYLYTAKSFVSLTKESPCIPCSTCGCLHFRSSMRESYMQCKRSLQEMSQEFATASSANGIEVQAERQTIMTCVRCIRDDSSPKKFSPDNGMILPDVPACFKSLTSLEERLISPFMAFMKVKLLGVNQQKALVGGIVTVPLDVIQVCENLPQTLHTCEAVLVCLKRNLSMKHAHVQGPVRVALLELCLSKLLQYCVLYNDLGTTSTKEAFVRLAKAVEQAQQEPVTRNVLLREDIDSSLIGENHVTFFNAIPSYSLPDKGKRSFPLHTACLRDRCRTPTFIDVPLQLVALKKVAYKAKPLHTEHTPWQRLHPWRRLHP